MSDNRAARFARARAWLSRAVYSDGRRLAALPRWLRLRGKRRFARASLIGMIGALAGFGLNLWGMQEQVCSASLMQPVASDLCGALGLGRKPTRAERVAWEALPPGDCAALEAFAGQYAGSSYQAAIAQRLQMRRFLTSARETQFVVDPETPGYVRQSMERFATRAQAEDQARTAAIADAAESLCRPADGGIRLERVDLTGFVPQCPEISGKFICSADYRARCHLRGRRVVEWCGPGKPK